MNERRFRCRSSSAPARPAAAAILLARAGWSVALVEKAALSAPQGLRRVHRGEQPAAARRARPRRALDAQAGPPLRRVALMRGDALVVAAAAAGGAWRRWGRALGRETLDTLLLEQARAPVCRDLAAVVGAGARRRVPARLRCALPTLRCRSTATQRRRHLARAPSRRGAWLVGAAAFGERPRVDRGRPATCSPSRRTSATRARRRPAAGAVVRGGYGGMVVADGGVTTLAGCIRRDRLDPARGSVRRARRRRRRGPLKRECRGVATRSPAPCATAPGSPRAARPGSALGSASGTGCSASAMRPARRIRSSAKASAWRCNRPGCCALCSTRAVRGCSMRDAASVHARVAATGAMAARFMPRLRLAAAFAHAAMRPRSPALRGAGRALARLADPRCARGGKLRCAAEAMPFVAGAGLAAVARRVTGAASSRYSTASTPCAASRSSGWRSSTSAST